MAEIFTYGDIVTNDLFVGRNDLVKEMQVCMDVCQTCILYGSRRVGKSSLVHEAVRQYKKENKKQKHLFLYMDLSTCVSSKNFISLLCLEINQMIERNKSLKQKFADISDFISSIRPTASIDPITGQVEYSVDFVGDKDQVPQTINKALELLESISKDYKITVVFDEFHVIAKWDDSDPVQWQIRSKLQLQKNICYIFLGSSRKLMSDLFLKSQSALYHSGNLLHIDNKLSHVDLTKWIKARFKKAKCEIQDDALKYLLDISKCHPYYTQRLCYKAWIESVKYSQDTIIKKDLISAVQKTINDEKYAFKERFESLTNNQQLVLKALANMEKYSLAKIEEYTKLHKSSIKSAINSILKLDEQLMHEEDKEYIIENPFFELWLKS